MKMTHLKLSALAFLASAPSLMAITSTQTYEFQWNTASSGFSPTFVYVTVALDTPTAASTAIGNFQVITPDGAWSPTSLTGTTAGPGSSATPIWSDGTVEVTGGGSTLLFIAPADLNANATLPANFNPNHYNVQLGTTFVTDTAYIANLTSPAGSVGTWSLVVPTVPEASSTWMLLAAAAAGLAWFQRRKTQAS